MWPDPLVCLLCFSVQHLLLAAVPWDSAPGPTSLTQAPVGLPGLSRAQCLLSVHLFPPSPPCAPASWVRKGKARENSLMLSTLCPVQTAPALTTKLSLFTSTWVVLAVLRVGAAASASASAQCASYEPRVLVAPSRSLKLPRSQGHAS